MLRRTSHDGCVPVVGGMPKPKARACLSLAGPAWPRFAWPCHPIGSYPSVNAVNDGAQGRTQAGVKPRRFAKGLGDATTTSHKQLR